MKISPWMGGNLNFSDIRFCLIDLERLRKFQYGDGGKFKGCVM